MRLLIKYSVLLFLLLFIGYAQQLFHLPKKNNFSDACVSTNIAAYFQPLKIKATEEVIFIEEEEEKHASLSLKSNPNKLDTSSTLNPYLRDHHDQQSKIYITGSKPLSSIYSLRSPYLLHCVFRI